MYAGHPIIIYYINRDLHANFYGDHRRGTPQSEALNARGRLAFNASDGGVEERWQNTAMLDLSKAISHKRYKIDV